MILSRERIAEVKREALTCGRNTRADRSDRRPSLVNLIALPRGLPPNRKLVHNFPGEADTRAWAPTPGIKGDECPGFSSVDCRAAGC